jgi:NADPH:quinone reductase
MKALVYQKAHSLEDFAITLSEVAEPVLRDQDVLVDVRAVGINPGEAFFRRTRSAEPGARVLLGLEFAGVVIGLGSAEQCFAIGDRVYGTGDMTRDGAWAERLAVDHRILARIPDVLSFVEAASLPIGALTAWESIFRDQDRMPSGIARVLVLGGAGAVGSLATQLLRAKTNAFVISTGSRAESREWCLKMGAHLVLDHGGDLVAQLAAIGIPDVDMVLSTAKTADSVGWIAKLLRPYGHLSTVDVPSSLDMNALMLKSVSLHTEMVFSRISHESNPEIQGPILSAVACLVAEGSMRPIVTTQLDGLTSETLKAAHALVETGHTIGKIVLNFS